MSDDELLDTVLREAALHIGRRVRIDLDYPEAWALIGLLQLGLRHPDISDGMRATVREVLDRMADGVADSPALRDLYYRGFV
jgi:hypothetical protein